MSTAALIALQGIAGSGDKLYSFAVPQELCGKIAVGSRVLVPFGVSNKKYRGVVFGLTAADNTQKLKPVLSLVDETPLLDGEAIAIAAFMKRRYFCSYYDAVKALLPSAASLTISESFSVAQPYEGGDPADEEIYDYISSHDGISLTKLKQLFPHCEKRIKALVKKGYITTHSKVNRKLGDRTVCMVRLSPTADLSGKLRSEKWVECVNLLKEKGDLSDKELMYLTGIKKPALVTMKSRGILEFYEEESLRRPALAAIATADTAKLSPDQKKAYSTILNTQKTVSLLYGVTGSGKTHVFLELVSHYLEQNQGAIMLVPEISLTAQMTARFHRRFGGNLAIIHSGLSEGERYDEWKRIKSGEAKVVIGTRSAVFAPVQNLGLIIIDEEQEHTYKSEMSPRYSAREVAIYRLSLAQKEGRDCRLVLSSATPSIDSFHKAKEGKYQLVELSHRYNKAPLPDCTVVDMRQELRSGNSGVFSEKLKEELARNLACGEQSILFINRRGYNSMVSCRSCGYVAKCPHCDISMTYHASNNRLMCHYCGYSIPTFSSCPNCSEKHIKYMGTGTQKAEDELKMLFPDARVCRMDADTTLRKSSHQKIIEAFAAGKYDILVGTQMITKGLDFENVTLAAVVSADVGLYSSEFRAAERTFSLLTQLTGRAGRGGKQGRAIIQTYTPENPVLGLAITQDYLKFFQSEIVYRQSLLYPPFCDICQVLFEGKDQQAVQTVASEFTEVLKSHSAGAPQIPVQGFGPMPAAIPRMGDSYRYKLLIKCRAGNAFSDFLNKVTETFRQNNSQKTVSIRIDINPENIS